jgi:serine/threonine protein phosphatase 1
VFLKGNHEEALLQFLSNASIGKTWENFGGVATLASYGVLHGSGESWPDTRAAFAMALPEAHLAFYKNLRLHHAVGDYLFVHAGLRPYVRLEDQMEHDLLWIREEFLESEATFGQVVVHGHTPTREPVLRHNRIGIDTGACHTGKLTALVLEGRERRFLST